MRYNRQLLILTVLALSGCGQTSRSPGTRLPVPDYPSAQHRTVDQNEWAPYNWGHTKTTFDTPDSPATVRAWYQTTFPTLGWRAGDPRDFRVSNLIPTPQDPADLPLSMNPIVRQDMLLFEDPLAVCPDISTEIYSTSTADGGTHVEVHYSIGECFN
jgi:hypothetical protein